MAVPTVAGRVLGREITRFRTRAGMSANATARVVETSPQTFGRIEAGVKAKVPDLWINALANAFGCTDAERRLLLSLAADVRTGSTSGPWSTSRSSSATCTWSGRMRSRGIGRLYTVSAR